MNDRRHTGRRKTDVYAWNPGFEPIKYTGEYGLAGETNKVKISDAAEEDMRIGSMGASKWGCRLASEESKEQVKAFTTLYISCCIPEYHLRIINSCRLIAQKPYYKP